MNILFNSSKKTQLKKGRRFLLPTISVCLFTVSLFGCSQSDSAKAVVPVEISSHTACDLDGMLLSDYPGPKGQIFYAGQAEPMFFCDTVELFHTVLSPEQIKSIRNIFVQDMGKTDWDQPTSNWIDAKNAYFVLGSKRHGSMGPTIASFSAEADAQKLINESGGKLYRFGDIKIDMVGLSGGALHDTRM